MMSNVQRIIQEEQKSLNVIQSRYAAADAHQAYLDRCKRRKIKNDLVITHPIKPQPIKPPIIKKKVVANCFGNLAYSSDEEEEDEEKEVPKTSVKTKKTTLSWADMCEDEDSD
jgi:hypothetical protein